MADETAYRHVTVSNRDGSGLKNRSVLSETDEHDFVVTEPRIVSEGYASDSEFYDDHRTIVTIPETTERL